MSNNYTLWRGDCLERMKDIPDDSVDMVLVDLPYGTTQNKWDSVIPFKPMWSQLNRIVKQNGAMVFTAQAPFDKILGSSNIDNLKYEWIWKKTKPTGHLNSKKQPMKAHENILVFYRQQVNYNPQGLYRLDKPVIRTGGNNGSNYGDSSKSSIRTMGGYPLSIIEFPSESKTVHPIQKPVELMEYLIKTYTLEGETVLDFTMGSGTTGVACKNLSRSFIGIERDPKYFTIACSRMGVMPS